MFDKILFGTIASGRPLAPPTPSQYLLAITNWVGEATDQLAIFDAASNTLVAMTGLQVSNAISIAVHPSGEYIAILSTDAPYLRVYEYPSLTPVAITGLSVTGVAIQAEVKFSNNGQFLAISTTSGIRIVRCSDWTHVASGGAGLNLYGLSISPDSSTIVSGGLVSPYLFACDPSDGSQIVGTPNPSSNSYGLSYNSAGDRLLYARFSNVVYEYELPSWTRRTISGSTAVGGKYAAYTSDESSIIVLRQSATGTVQTYNASTLVLQDTVNLPNSAVFRLSVPVGMPLAACGLNSSTGNPGMVVFDTDTMLQVPLVGADTTGVLVRALTYGYLVS